MEEVLQLQAEEVEMEQHRCIVNSYSSGGTICASIDC
jgi:hypothetical protein